MRRILTVLFLFCLPAQANMAYYTMLNGSSQLGAFTYTGTGHHVMHQALHLMALQIVNDKS